MELRRWSVGLLVAGLALGACSGSATHTASSTASSSSPATSSRSTVVTFSCGITPCAPSGNYDCGATTCVTSVDNGGSTTSTAAPSILQVTDTNWDGSFQARVGEIIQVTLSTNPGTVSRWIATAPGVLQLESQSTSSVSDQAAFRVIALGSSDIVGQRRPSCPPGFTGGCASLGPFRVTVTAAALAKL